MPMDFPDMESLENRAKDRGFRQPNEGESELEYRYAFSDFMVDVDGIESSEIRFGKGWDQWDEAEKASAMLTMMRKKRTE